MSIKKSLTEHILTMIKRFTMLAALGILLSGPVSLSSAAQKPIDPHWTGKHCTECHLTNKDPELRYGGTIKQVCNRCHGEDPPPCVKVHPEGISLPERMKEIIAIDWPLEKEAITCLTCHDARLQMDKNKKAENKNSNFLRGLGPVDPVLFCFNCHQKERFKKINPHQLTDREVCFRCHTENLTRGLEIGFKSSVKTVNPSLCLGCHGDLPEAHLKHAFVGKDKTDAYKMVLETYQLEGIELPLTDGRMHCSTCHNQHPAGIIGRKEAAIGAGEEHFLRLPANRLCAVCHTDKPVDTFMERFQKN